MTSLIVLVMHSGKWYNDNPYVDYATEWVVYKESSSYKELYNIIAMQLGVDMNAIKLKMSIRLKKEINQCHLQRHGC